jgi:hypothetical protein
MAHGGLKVPSIVGEWGLWEATFPVQTNLSSFVHSAMHLSRFCASLHRIAACFEADM